MTIVLSAAVATLWAQRFDYVERRNGWNGGANAAGLRRDSISLSYAEVYAVKSGGEFVDFSSSPDSWNAGARTKSILHFDRVSFAGGFGYDYFDGRDMCGSMFTKPGFYPFDILEFTPGRKIREIYDLDGRAAISFGRGWTGGLAADFEASNYAKRKDLRHSNRRLDFGVAPSLLYARGDFAIGAAYLFRKDAERVTADEIGSTPDSYEAFFDKGLAFGVGELWTGSGIHLDESGVSGFPVSEIIHGASLQSQWHRLYAEAEFRYGHGHTGERGVEWHDFDSRGVELRVSAWFGPETDVHFVRLAASWTERRNRENILGKQTVNGVTETYIYGSNTIYTERTVRVKAEYEYACARTDLRAGAEVLLTDGLSSLMYPYAYGRKMYRTVLYADNRLTAGRFEILASVRFSWGGSSQYDASTTSAADAGDYPERLTQYYEYATEYFTAGRIETGVGVRCNVAKGIYVEASGMWRHGFRLRYIGGSEAYMAILKVGYSF